MRSCGDLLEIRKFERSIEKCIPLIARFKPLFHMRYVLLQFENNISFIRPFRFETFNDLLSLSHSNTHLILSLSSSRSQTLLPNFQKNRYRTTSSKSEQSSLTPPIIVHGNSFFSKFLPHFRQWVSLATLYSPYSFSSILFACFDFVQCWFSYALSLVLPSPISPINHSPQLSLGRIPFSSFSK